MVSVFVGTFGKNCITSIALVVAVCVLANAYSLVTNVASVVGGAVSTLGKNLFAKVALVVVVRISALGKSSFAGVAKVVVVCISALVTEKCTRGEAKGYADRKSDKRDDGILVHSFHFEKPPGGSAGFYRQNQNFNLF